MFDSSKVLTAEVKDLGAVFAANGFSLRVVGGAVRDLFLGKTPKDVDFATDATPDEMISFLEADGRVVIPTGLQHGTISVLGSLDEPYEITTLRIDTETDGRHAEVEFTRDFELDAARRDLTFNAMSMDMDGNVFDYFGGEKDLMNGTARFVGDAETRIQEDYLRILRFFRFQGRMKHVSIDQETWTAVWKNAKGLQKISGERIWAELQKILGSEHAEELLINMVETGTAEHASIPVDLAGFRKSMSTNPVALLAALCGTQENVNVVVERMKPSAKERDLMTFLVNTNVGLEEAKVMSTDKVSKDFLVEMFLMKGDVNSAKEMQEFDVPEFPVLGRDLLAKGWTAGPHLGKKLKELKTKWVQSKFTLTKESLLDEN